MDFSIIIPVASDLKVKYCIDSINEDVEIVVVLNGATKEVKEIINTIKNKNIKILELPDRNLGASLEYGIIYATYDNVLLMDSDCTFEKHCISNLYKGLSNSYIAKGKIIFPYYNISTRVVSKVCDFRFGDKKNSFKPPIALKKSIKDVMGGYYYNTKIHWLEDVEFEQRRLKYGIKINFVNNAIIYHTPKTIFRDMKSAFYYGIGARIGIKNNLLKTEILLGRVPNIVISLLCEPLHLLIFLPIQFVKVLINKGILPAFYYLLFRFAYRIGYYYQSIFDPYKTELRKLV